MRRSLVFAYVAAVTVFFTSFVASAQCLTMQLGYSTCNPVMGPAARSSEDLKIGYDINAASGNLFVVQQDLHVYTGNGPDLYFTRYYNSQASGVDLGIGANWSHTYAWRANWNSTESVVVEDTGHIVHFSFSNGGYVPAPGEFGSFTVTPTDRDPRDNVISYTNKFGVVYNFNYAGYLTSIYPPDDSPITINYVNSGFPQISTVQSGSSVLTFTYSESEIVSVTDPRGSVWKYTYGNNPNDYLANSELNEFFQYQNKAPTNGQLLTDVSTPINSQSCFYPGGSWSMPIVADTYYSYSYNQWQAPPTVAGTTPVGQNNLAELTGVAAAIWRQQSCLPPWPSGFSGPGIDVILMYNYSSAITANWQSTLYGSGATSPDLVTHAVAGIVGGVYQRDVQLVYNGTGVQTVETMVHVGATLSGPIAPGTATKVATSMVTGSNSPPRMTSLSSSGGVGLPGETQLEKWKWNTSLTLMSYTDAVGNVTSFSSYDALGNPQTIVESYAAGSPALVAEQAPPRTTTICYSPTSRPLKITRRSVDGNPNHFHTIAWDYTDSYGPYTSVGCSQSNQTSFVHQIVESGYTDQTLSGKIGPQEWHPIQIQYQDLNGNTTDFPSNTHLEISSIADPLTNAQSTVSYDSLGRMSALSLVVGGGGVPFLTPISNPTYDADGRILTYIDINGNQRAFTYDLRGLTTSQVVGPSTQPFSEKSNTYDLAGNMTMQQVEGGTDFSWSFDAAMRPTSLSATAASGSGGWTRFMNLDLFGKPLTLRSLLGGDASGASTEGSSCAKNATEQFCLGMVYDAFERLAQVGTLAPDNTTTSCSAGCGQTLTYDANGLLQTRSIFQDLNSYYKYARDSLNRVVQISDNSSSQSISLGDPAIISYNSNNNVVTRQDHLSTLTQYVYDDFGRRIALISPDAGTWISNYDVDGNLTASRDPNGILATYTYDALNRMTRYHSNGVDDITYVYDEGGTIPGSSGAQFTNTQGRLSSVLATAVPLSNSTSATPVNEHWSYDPLGRPIIQVDERGPDVDVPNAMPIDNTVLQWGASDELDGMQYPDGLNIVYEPSDSFDLHGSPLPLSVSTSLGPHNTHQIASNITYFADGQVNSLTFGSGSQYQASRNKRGEVTGVVSGPSNSPLVSESYNYNSFQVGLPTVVAATVSAQGGGPETRTISYSPFGLTLTYARSASSSPTQTVQWSYDPDGNPATLAFNGVQAINNNNQPPYSLPGYWQGSTSNEVAQTQGIAVGAVTPPPISSIIYDNGGNLQTNGFTVPAVAAVGTLNDYDTRRRLSETEWDSWSKSVPPGPPDFHNVWRQYNYDGLDRLWERVDNISHLYPARGATFVAQPGQLPPGEQAEGGVHRYFYDPLGRIIEEFESLRGPSGNYLVTDHIYIGQTTHEVARLVSTWSGSTLENRLIQYIHVDGHGAIFAVETNETSSSQASWSDSISPFATMLSYGQISPHALMSTEEAIATTLPLKLSGISGASGYPALDGYIANFSTCGGATGCQIVGILDPLVGLSSVPTENVMNLYGWSAYRGVRDPPEDGNGIVGYVDSGSGIAGTQGPNEPQFSGDVSQIFGPNYSGPLPEGTGGYTSVGYTSLGYAYAGAQLKQCVGPPGLFETPQKQGIGSWLIPLIIVAAGGGPENPIADLAAGAEAAAANVTVATEITTAEGVADFSAIGSTGQIGEAALQELGGESQAYFNTNLGGRYVDQLIDGWANEAKVGYQSLTSTNRLQILKDVDLINSGQINGSTWHFFTSPVTGFGGPSAPLSSFLEQYGIGIVMH